MRINSLLLEYDIYDAYQSSQLTGLDKIMLLSITHKPCFTYVSNGMKKKSAMNVQQFINKVS